MSLAAVAGGVLFAQQPSAKAPATGTKVVTLDLGLTVAGERGQDSASSAGIWMRGGAVDLTALRPKGYGAKVSASIEYAPHVASNVGVNTRLFVMGPVYDRSLDKFLPSKRPELKQLHLFGEGLLGAVEGFNGVYPAQSQSNSDADAFAVMAGGGLNLDMKQRGGLRLLQVDYVRTGLPNNSNNVQNNLRIGFGANIRLW
ncbi:hypothetical protein ACOBR2_07585 [Telmatobacter bradus]|uniref:hypothetical protein n=1 Tax=Telmatobacter bradus TaxID=474953 RepID=UPI003B437F59